MLDAGRIVESGSHAQLMGGSGLYARLAKAQHIESPLEPAGVGQ